MINRDTDEHRKNNKEQQRTGMERSQHKEHETKREQSKKQKQKQKDQSRVLTKATKFVMPLCWS